MKRIVRFWHKNAWKDKHNHYVFVLACDKNGNTLRNTFPSIPEFWETVNDTTFYYSDIFCNKAAIDMGLDTKISKFKKVVDEDSLRTVFKNDSKFERGRAPKKGKYYFQNMFDFLYHEEIFFNGIVWCFGNLEFLQDLKGVIDEIRICRCNVDFAELYPSEMLDIWPVDKWLNKHGFVRSDNHRPQQSEKWLSTIKSSKPISEDIVWDNGFVVKKQAQPKSKILKDIPDLYDYMFEIWKR